MKGLFLYDHPIPEQERTGVDRKVLNQIKVMNACGLSCEAYFWDDSHKKMQAILARLPFGGGIPPWRYDKAFEEADFLYFRKPSFLSGDMRRVLKRIRRSNPNVKIVMEIPTYPYDTEMMEFVKDRPFLWKDHFHRSRLKGLVDCLAVIGDKTYNELFGLPVVMIKNGLDLSTIRLRSPAEDDVIDLCAVAMFAPWHGYERLIEGLIRYYERGGQRPFCLHLVGEGQEKAAYERLAQHPLAKGRVIFYGMLGGNELNAIYDRADIGVCSLGMYKKGNNFIGVLKAREYLAKGLPMLATAPFDLTENGNPDYYLQCDNSATPIDFEKVAEFYDALHQEKNQPAATAKRMRALAENTIDMRVTFKPVIDYLLSFQKESSSVQGR